MRTFRLFILFLMGSLFSSSAQEALSAYKYVVVPTKFESFKRENQYQTSTLVKHQLVQRGFNAVYDNAIPSELNNNRCLGLTAVLVNDSGMLTTKGYIIFKDCQSQEVFRTATGASKVKDYKGAFKEVIGEAMESFGNYRYTYEPPAKSNTPVALVTEDTMKDPEPDPVTVVTEEEEITEVKEEKTIPVVEEKEVDIPEEVTAGNPLEVEVTQEAASAVPVVKDLSVWYAQEIPNGFQLVDSSPKVRMRIYQTQKRGVFLAKGEDHEGLVYEEGGSWYFDYYQDGKLVHESLNIKF